MNTLETISGIFTDIKLAEKMIFYINNIPENEDIHTIRT